MKKRKLVCTVGSKGLLHRKGGEVEGIEGGGGGTGGTTNKPVDAHLHPA